MFGRKGRTEVEVGENGEAVSGGKKVATTMIPRWMQIVHYVMHAVLLVIIILLIVAIALVESDARSEDDGTANKILSAFNLQVDGSVSSAFDCAEASAPPPATPPPSSSSSSSGGGSASVQFSGGSVSGVDVVDTETGLTSAEQTCLKNAVGFHGLFYDETGTIEDIEAMIDTEDFVSVDVGGTQYWPEFRMQAESYCCGPGSLAWGDPSSPQPTIKGFVSGTRAIVYREKQMRGFEQPKSNFYTYDCDPATGKLETRVRFPDLVHENIRMNMMLLMLDIFTGDEDISAFESIKFSDDVVFITNGGRYYGNDVIMALQGSLAYQQQYFAVTGATLKRTVFVSPREASSIIARVEVMEPESMGPRNTGLFEIGFNLDDEIKSLYYMESDASNMHGTQVHKWHDIFTPSTQYSSQYNLLDDMLTEDYEFHMMGFIGNRESIKMWGKRQDEIAAASSAAAPPADRKIFQISGEGQNTMYVLSSISIYTSEGELLPRSIIWRHDFEAAEEGSLALNPSNKIRSTIGYIAPDIMNMAMAIEAFEGTRKFSDVGSTSTLDTYDNLKVTDDFSIDTMWQGWTNYTAFREQTVFWKDMRSDPKSWAYAKFGDAEYRQRTRLMYNSGGKHVAMQQGYFVPKGTPPLFDPLSTPGIVESTVDMFYFESGGPAATARLQKVYMYNSTAIMQ